MVLAQYLASCNSWNQGLGGVATTVVAGDACTWTGQKTEGGIPVYSRTTCTSDDQQVKLYAGDNTCSTTAISTTTSTNLCHFFNTQGGLKIYTALIKCVVDGERQRCADALVEYDAALTFENLGTEVDFQQVYDGLFEFATVTATEVNDSSTLYHLSLEFCSKFEDAKYDDAVKYLGSTTLNADSVPDNGAIMSWTCIDYVCRNSSLCGTDNYCNTTRQYYYQPTTTEVDGSSIDGSSTTIVDPEDPDKTTKEPEASSANAIYVSFTLMMGLLLSLTLL